MRKVYSGCDPRSSALIRGRPFLGLLHSHRLRQVPWLVDVAAATDCNVVGEQLQRHNFKDGKQQLLQGRQGEAGRAQLLDPLVADLTLIAGQKPVTTKAKKSIAAFKVRAGMSIGAMVTLRSDKAYEFLDRLISTALPRVRDFRGVSTKSFDGRGNYTLGLRDQLIFPEIDYSKVEKLKGMNITIVTTAKDDNGARALLRHFGMPFRQGA